MKRKKTTNELRRKIQTTNTMKLLKNQGTSTTPTQLTSRAHASPQSRIKKDNPIA